MKKALKLLSILLFSIVILDPSISAAKSCKLGRNCGGDSTGAGNRKSLNEDLGCTVDSDCKTGFVCRSNKCINPCSKNKCDKGEYCYVDRTSEKGYGCGQCVNNSQCKTLGEYCNLDSHLCKKCEIENCLSCNTDGLTCDKCGNGTKLSTDKKSCIPCNPTTQTGLVNENTIRCNECKFNEAGDAYCTKADCKEGYSDLYENGICQKVECQTAGEVYFEGYGCKNPCPNTACPGGKWKLHTDKTCCCEDNYGYHPYVPPVAPNVTPEVNVTPTYHGGGGGGGARAMHEDIVNEMEYNSLR